MQPTIRISIAWKAGRFAPFSSVFSPLAKADEVGREECMSKRIIAVVDVLDAAKAGSKTIPAPAAECIVTAGAREKAAELGIVIAEATGSAEPPARVADNIPPSQADQVVQQVCALLKDRLPSGSYAGELERLVRDVVASRLVATPPPRPGPAGALDSVDGVCLIRGARLLDTGAGPVPVAEKVLVADAIRCGENYKLAGGYMEWEKASFSRTVDFPEIGIVLAGELHLAVGGKTLVAKSGDMVYFPKGAHVVYSAPARVRIACVNCIV